MELSVKGSGATKSFKLSGVEGTSTVLELKKKCEAECGLAPEQQRLFLKGKLLKDDDTLEAAKIADKATLFLVKGAGGAAAGSAAASGEAEKKKEDETPAATVNCAGGCGFYGNAKFDNYCSKCWGKKQKDEDDEAEKARKERQEAEKAKEEEKKKEEGGGAAAAEVKEREVQTDKTKCWKCNKKCGLTGFDCRCGYVFCAKHRYAEEHDCDFDHISKGREILANTMTGLVTKEKDRLDSV